MKSEVVARGGGVGTRRRDRTRATARGGSVCGVIASRSHHGPSQAGRSLPRRPRGAFDPGPGAARWLCSGDPTCAFRTRHCASGTAQDRRRAEGGDQGSRSLEQGRSGASAAADRYRLAARRPPLTSVRRTVHRNAGRQVQRGVLLVARISRKRISQHLDSPDA